MSGAEVVFETGADPDKTPDLGSARTLRQPQRSRQTVEVPRRSKILTRFGIPGGVDHAIDVPTDIGTPFDTLGPHVRSRDNRLDRVRLCNFASRRVPDDESHFAILLDKRSQHLPANKAGRSGQQNQPRSRIGRHDGMNLGQSMYWPYLAQVMRRI